MNWQNSKRSKGGEKGEEEDIPIKPVQIQGKDLPMFLIDCCRGSEQFFLRPTNQSI
jgi:hypothetical protein